MGFRTERIADPLPGGSLQRIINVWYPAEPGGKALSFQEYVAKHEASLLPDPAKVSPSAALLSLRNSLVRFYGPFSEERWKALLETPFIASADAKPKQGKFPLLIGTLRAHSTNVTNEYLASHGYVVAMVYSVFKPVIPGGRGQFNYPMSLADLEETADRMAKDPQVNPEKVGSYGFSGAGITQLLYAMKHPDRIDALADIESAIFFKGINPGSPPHNFKDWDPKKLQTPFLHMYSVQLAANDDMFEEFGQMVNSDRYHLLVDLPGQHHWDFATEGIAGVTVLDRRQDLAAGVKGLFEASNRTLLRFFDAFLKDERSALQTLKGPVPVEGQKERFAWIDRWPKGSTTKMN